MHYVASALVGVLVAARGINPLFRRLGLRAQRMIGIGDWLLGQKYRQVSLSKCPARMRD